MEEKYWANDVAIEEEMERLIITVTSSDTASETDDYSDTDSDLVTRPKRNRQHYFSLL